MRNPAWEAIGFLGQAVFFGRFIIQWVASERKKRTVVPVAFWYMSLLGGFITLLYAIHVGRLVFILAFSLSSIIYVRNLVIYYKRRTRRKGLVFASGPELGDVPDVSDEDESTD
ncbi:MAG: lipid A biosynthesis protein [Planctomycetes bacterium]|nr:lipid A biosynthesis protein [Planctomycetota bacterium]